MTAAIPTIADIVGADREAEARALLEQLLARETDPDAADGWETGAPVVAAWPVGKGEFRPTNAGDIMAHVAEHMLGR